MTGEIREVVERKRQRCEERPHVVLKKGVYRTVKCPRNRHPVREMELVTPKGRHVVVLRLLPEEVER